MLGRHVWPAGVGVGLAALSLMAATRLKKVSTQPLYVRIALTQFLGSYLAKWLHAHGPIDKLLPSATDAVSSSHSFPAPDLMAFSFDRVLVTAM